MTSKLLPGTHPNDIHLHLPLHDDFPFLKMGLLFGSVCVFFTLFLFLFPISFPFIIPCPTRPVPVVFVFSLYFPFHLHFIASIATPTWFSPLLLLPYAATGSKGSTSIYLFAFASFDSPPKWLSDKVKIHDSLWVGREINSHSLLRSERVYQ